MSSAFIYRGEPHPLAGKTIKVTAGEFAGQDYRIEDWAYRVFGQSWQDYDGHAASLEYAVRSGFDNLPVDDNVLYGKIDYLGKIMHVSQLALSGLSDADSNTMERGSVVLGGQYVHKRTGVTYTVFDSVQVKIDGTWFAAFAYIQRNVPEAEVYVRTEYDFRANFRPAYGE